MKLLKYSLVLAGIFFISAIIPGIICILCGFNGVWASSGISLAIVCLLKGKIAKKIFGPHSTHRSAPNTAFFLIAISLISGGIKAYTYYINKATIENLGFTYESTREQVFSQLFVPLLIASLFWAIILGIVTFIRGKQKKHQVQEVVSQSEAESSSSSQSLVNSDLRKEVLTSNIVSKEETLHTDKTSNTPNNTIKIADRPKSNSKFFNTISNYKKYLWAILGIIAVIAIVLFGISKFGSSRDSDNIGEFLYIDLYGNVHADKNCSAISSISVNHIEVRAVSVDNLQKCCHICVNDNIYRNLKETYKNEVIDIRLSNIFEILRKYNISNIPSNRNDFDKWLEADQENLEYLYNILSLMQVNGIGSDITFFKSWLNSDDKSTTEVSTSLMRLYDICEREGLDVGDFNEFLKYIQYDENYMQWFYNKLVELNYDVKSYQLFHNVTTALVSYETTN